MVLIDRWGDYYSLHYAGLTIIDKDVCDVRVRKILWDTMPVKHRTLAVHDEFFPFWVGLPLVFFSPGELRASLIYSSTIVEIENVSTRKSCENSEMKLVVKQSFKESTMCDEFFQKKLQT